MRFRQNSLKYNILKIMVFAPPAKNKVLGVFQLVMINVIAVDSIRTIPFSAEYGFSLVFYYIAAAILFFIPSALISAELGSGWPNTGGIYVWVREAFGKNTSLIVIWLNWIYNVVWYPTIMALIAGTITYFFNPEYAQNKFYMVCTILALFWGTTYLNCRGMKASSAFSSFSAIIGTIFPMLLIGSLGIYWALSGKPMEITFSWKEFIPSANSYSDLAFLGNVLFGLIGLEMAATHAAEMKDPKRDYPKAIAISVVVILLTIVFASLAVAMVVPKDKLDLVTGTTQALSLFVKHLNIPWLLPLIAFFIVLGGLGGVGAWIIGPPKGLMVAADDDSLPKFLAKTNNKNVPVNILLLQGFIVSFLCFAFIIMPSVKSSFWLLSAITAQLAMIVYLFLFLAGIKLHFSKPDVPRTFRIPLGRVGIIITTIFGCLACLGTICLGFIPPLHLGITNVFNYELTLIAGMAILCMIPILIHKFSKI